MGDELALRNDEDYHRVPEHADDNRWLHRPALPWERADERHDEHTDAGRAWAGIRRLVTARASLESLHGSVRTQVVPTSHPSVVLFVRHHPAGDLVQVYNVSEQTVWLAYDEVARHGSSLGYDRLADREVHTMDGQLVLGPYAALWLTGRP